jgi:uncharacterized protein YjbI with pentapeptide repeats
MPPSGLVRTVETRGLLTNWVIHGAASHERFSSEPADAKELKVFLERCRFEEVDFSGIDFASFYAAGSSFIRCDFTRTRFLQLQFGQPQIQRSWDRRIEPNDPRYPQTVYEACVFSHTRFDSDNTHFGNARFVGCVFDHAWLRKLFFFNAEFVECRFIGKVIDCVFDGRVIGVDAAQRIGRSTNEFHRNDFREADLIGTAFRAIDLDMQLLPESDSYSTLRDPIRQIEVARNRAEAELVGEMRDRVVRALDLLAGRTQWPGYAGQLLIRKGELGWKLSAEVQDLMWMYLTGRRTPHTDSQT